MIRWYAGWVLVVSALFAPWACKLYVPPEGAYTENTTLESSQESNELPEQDGGESVETVGETGTAQIPTTADELVAYLKNGGYRAWPQESKPHLTQGPHKSGSQVFINEILQQSLQAGNTSHPQGAIAIKELYEIDLKTPAGWSVMVKVDVESQGGQGWYWFEVFTSNLGDRYIADGMGVQLCTGCHMPGKDFFLSKFPLE